MTDFVTRALAGFSADVSAHARPQVLRLGNVRRLVSTVTAAVPEHTCVGLLDLVECLHPTPAVGGYPRPAALRWTAGSEPFDRGWYAAPIGWLDSMQDGEMAVAIRSALVSGNRAALFAGCGAVTGSTPEEEYAETELKLRPSLVGGTTPVLCERFEPTALIGTGAAYVALVPTMLYSALRADVDLRRYAAVLIGGAPAAPALLAQARAVGVPVVTTYGMTETCGGCVYDGRSLAGVRVDVGADGRVRIAGPVLARGYRLRPQLTSAAFRDGFRTDDLGRLTADGRLQILGRADEVIVTGGKKVHPQQAEALLCAHHSVAEALVVGVADAE